MNVRVGEGWDVHALVPGRKLVIGGVEIPFHLGLLGHSDADVLLHAITDALLGAAALGDIGTHFPDTSAEHAGADSWVLLQRCGQLLAGEGWRVGNIDCTVVAQAPKLAGYKAAMAGRIAAALQIDVGQVNVKAKTAEKLGPVGEGRSIEARAIALLFR
jgi:2-C-methyl-D-erythritol 2,4-cyclodiphosphate synthase